jgi:UDP-N-acetyl-D-mannosaminuronate dehydrogenase
MGLAYKENSSDTRNSPVIEIYKKLKKNKEIKLIHVYDPLVDSNKFRGKIKIIKKLNKKYDGILVAVPHFCIVKSFYKKLKKITHKNTKILDVKYSFSKDKNITPL